MLAGRRTITSLEPSAPHRRMHVHRVGQRPALISTGQAQPEKDVHELVSEGRIKEIVPMVE